MTTYIINQLLQDASVDAGCNAFGIGHRAFDNLAFGRVVPFCWINTIDCEIRVLDNVSFENTYSITGNISTPANFDESPDTIQTAILSLTPVYERFISYLAECAIKLDHYHDDNHVGIDFQFKITIAEIHTYSCPA